VTLVPLMRLRTNLAADVNMLVPFTCGAHAPAHVKDAVRAMWTGQRAIGGRVALVLEESTMMGSGRCWASALSSDLASSAIVDTSFGV
jgi:hypothetical protein